MEEPEIHYIKAMDDPWFKLLVKLQNLLSIETMKFYEEKNLVTIHLPVTTGSISSPMGRGSDSLSVKVNLEGIDTYLADSMQFLLEYGCRLTDNGVYYIMPSFRGEKADSRHLCQFYHSEAEIIGNLDDIINLVEEYIKYLSKKIVEKLGTELKKAIGDISHVENIANYNGHFPRITFNEAEKELKQMYGDRFKKGGDMYEQINQFLDWAMSYDTSDDNLGSKSETDNWAKKFDCKVLYIDGSKPIGEKIKIILERIKEINNNKKRKS